MWMEGYCILYSHDNECLSEKMFLNDHDDKEIYWMKNSKKKRK